MDNAVLEGQVEEGISLDLCHATLESLATPIVVAGPDFVISYINDGMKEMISEHIRAFRDIFPWISVDTLIGTSIDRFHKHPLQIRRKLEELSGRPYRVEIPFGELRFAINATCIFDRAGEVMGYALQWNDVTPRARYDRELKRVLVALESGDLSVRGDVTPMSPEFRSVLQDLNEVIDTMAEPLVETMEILKSLSLGREVRPLTKARKGAYADLQDSVNGLIAALSQVSLIAKQIADGDLTIKVERRSEEDVLMGALGRMVTDLNALMYQVQDASGQLDLGSAQVQEASQTLANNASRAAASLEEISASMEEISVQTGENAKNATSAMELSTRARESADLGDQQMGNMVSAMKDIEESAQNISKIIKVIDDIAFQTNLLALNAAVEAGRAGVHGRGFAVVAEEVRRLAGRSAKAAKETTEMIEGSSRKVNQGLDIAKATAASLSAIVTSVGEVSDLVGEIAAASQEQASGISEINEALSHVDFGTQQNTAKAEEMAAAGRELSAQSSELTRHLQHFRLAGQPAGADPSSMSPEMMSALQLFMSQSGGGDVSALELLPMEAPGESQPGGGYEKLDFGDA
ncbi:MAG TPA: methyl-accepting chemotaxis protein [Deltaproteobacteria bacterium]|nr:methyl-accepting chemotaxis protein [Deltaproteobacteria bacterium]